MDDSISQISNVPNTSPKQMSQKRSAPEIQANLVVDNKKSSSRYVVENNSIVYEKYDDYGRLIFKIPWHARIVNQKV